MSKTFGYELYDEDGWKPSAMPFEVADELWRRKVWACEGEYFTCGDMRVGEMRIKEGE